MGPFLHALQNSAFSAWVVGSDTIWAYPMILTMHTVGLGIVVGAAVIIDLRLLGVGPGIPLEEVNRVFPIFWMGFFINLVSGDAARVPRQVALDRDWRGHHRTNTATVVRRGFAVDARRIKRSHACAHLAGRVGRRDCRGPSDGVFEINEDYGSVFRVD